MTDMDRCSLCWVIGAHHPTCPDRETVGGSVFGSSDERPKTEPVAMMPPRPVYLGSGRCSFPSDQCSCGAGE